ncbi:DUF2145 domain-containing protein [Acidovorax sp. SUPP1855]|uniref:DUF2145 domain-containing protein n=1 Tax=Acidovorax sp. SUPP1855 TaxID=431774 RepID=UPI0023DE5F55|nr:DUF2145 domain-containing protein [Acidovorax sp. SUPP1855]GKS87086.1 DUF2145 domain-containing protein [Acidovorax sp. SUPP1855]
MRRAALPSGVRPRRALARWTGIAAIGLAALGAEAPARAGTWGLCDAAAPLSATDQDRVLRFAAVVKQVLDASGQRVALISRSGLDLGRFGVRYSHAGLALRPQPDRPWAVRQLYYTCEESRPRLFDQGIPGFLMGRDDPSRGYVAIVLLPALPADALERTAQDKRAALALLAADYSANAYPFSTRYQNCNQWVAEMMASAWAPAGDAPPTRERAQAWLHSAGYRPEPIDLGSHGVVFAAHFAPLVHVDDHPRDDLYALRMRVSLPASLEAFVHDRMPGAERIELCHDRRQIVVRRGWQALGPGCEAGPQDELIALNP